MLINFFVYSNDKDILYIEIKAESSEEVELNFFINAKKIYVAVIYKVYYETI